MKFVLFLPYIDQRRNNADRWPLPLHLDTPRTSLASGVRVAGRGLTIALTRESLISAQTKYRIYLRSSVREVDPHPSQNIDPARLLRAVIERSLAAGDASGRRATGLRGTTEVTLAMCHEGIGCCSSHRQEVCEWLFTLSMVQRSLSSRSVW